MTRRNADTQKRRNTARSLTVAVLIGAAALATGLAPEALKAQELWSRIYLDSAGGEYKGAALLSNGAVFQSVGPIGQGGAVGTTTTILPTAPIGKVMCVLDCGAAGEVYAPHLMGLRIDPAWLAARSEWGWTGDEPELDLTFPGQAFAPLVAHYAQPIGWMVADVGRLRDQGIEGSGDQGKVRTLFTRNRIALEYRFEPKLEPGQVLTLRHMVSKTTTTTADTAVAPRRAMQALVAKLHEHWQDHESEDLQELHGYLNVQLQNQDQPHQHVMRLWADHGAKLRRLQLWGWTSDRYDGSPRTGCCLHLGEMHQRYLGLQWLLAALDANGWPTALYFNADDPKLDEWLKGREEIPLYIDVAGFRAHVRRTYGPGTIIEGATAASDDSFLVSGAGNGGKTRWPGGTRAHEQPCDWFGRLVFDRRACFDGDSNWSFADTTAATKYRTYRRCFWRGYKFDWQGPRAGAGDGASVVYGIIAEWERTNFWARGPVYLDTTGIEGSRDQGIEVTRFRDAEGKTLLAIDTTEALGGEWAVKCDGQAVAKPAKALAMVEIP